MHACVRVRVRGAGGESVWAVGMGVGVRVRTRVRMFVCICGLASIVPEHRFHQFPDIALASRIIARASIFTLVGPHRLQFRR